MIFGLNAGFTWLDREVFFKFFFHKSWSQETNFIIIIIALAPILSSLSSPVVFPDDVKVLMVGHNIEHSIL